MIDRTTKVLLAAIAVGLFFNAAVPLVQPSVVMAEEAQRGRGAVGRGRGQLEPNTEQRVLDLIRDGQALLGNSSNDNSSEQLDVLNSILEELRSMDANQRDMWDTLQSIDISLKQLVNNP